MALNQSNSPVEKFEKELRSHFPNVSLTFVSTIGDLTKALGPEPSPNQAGLYIHSDGTHQLAVSMAKNSVVLLAPFEDSTSHGHLNAALGLFTQNIGQIPVYLIGNIPPDSPPPCPVPPLCIWTAAAVVRAALGWRG